MKTAYLDCFSGISGDMFLGALLDAGLPFEELERALGTLPLGGYSIDRRREKRNELTATRFMVNIEDKRHEHRGMNEIKGIITSSRLSAHVKDRCLRIFESIAREEGKIHGISPESVHFHEVGAIDSIIDIAGTAFGIEFLKINFISASMIPLGSGFVDSGHGRIPVPAPATIALLKGIPVFGSGLEYELVTPTGAAIIKEYASAFGSMPPMTIESIGYGAGARNLPDRPNLLRIILGEERTEDQIETVAILEANLDDTNPEWLGYIMDRLFEAGALDVIFCPVQMKKNRPGVQVQIMGKPHHQNTLMEILIKESTTLGVRFRFCQRKVLARSHIEIESPWGMMKAKKIFWPDGSSFLQPEFESCKKIAAEKGLPLREIYSWVISANRT